MGTALTSQEKAMTYLDSSDKWEALDPQDMYGRIFRFPEQVSEAAEIGRKADLGSLGKKTFQNIVVAGLGGSAIGGDLVRSYAAEWLDVPQFLPG